MSKKIESLTAAQERDLVEFRQRMWEQGVSCAAVDRETAEAAITAAYAEIGRAKPVFFWMQSPMACELVLNILSLLASNDQRLKDGLMAGLRLEDGLGDGLRNGLGAGLWAGLGKFNGTWWWGQMDSYWLAFYRFGTDLGCQQKPEHLRRLAIMERISASCGFWYPRDGICIVSDRFSAVHWDEARNRQGMPFRLHSDEGPAVAFRDGWPMYYWHGLRIPAWLIEDKQRITPDAIDAEGNAELRRVMLEIFGFDRYIEARGAKTIATDEALGLPRELFEISLAGERVRVLRVVNGTIESDGRQRLFHLGVPLTVSTPHEAVAWSYGRPVDRHVEAVRT